MSPRAPRSAPGAASHSRGPRAGARLHLLAQAVASAAHDMTTAATSLSLRLDLLEGLLGDPHGANMTVLREVVSGLRVTSTSLSGQIASLRDLALIGGDGVLRVNRQRFDLLALLREAIDEFQGSMGRRHVVRFDAQVSTLEGEWDRRLVERLAANLLSNAHKYSSLEGEIQVSAWSEFPADGEWAAFSVKDRGIGIPASDLSRVFTPYERASNVGDTVGQGIGLASVWQIAQQHGGGVEIQSQVGSGTTVTVRLPVAASS